MNVYITKTNGRSLKDTLQYMQHMTTEIAHQLGCREMGIYRYNADAENTESRNSRFDGIIAGINRGDLVICQFPTGNGLRFERALVNHIKVYHGRIAIFVYEFEALAHENKRAMLQETVGLYNQAEVLIVPTYAMRDFLMDNGIRMGMKFVVQEMWDYAADDRFSNAKMFQKEIHFAGSDGFVGMNEWSYPVLLKLYNMSVSQGKNVFNMGEREPDQLLSELSKGGFGLVWYKDEDARRYMEYSVSFLLAKYLAAGIPVIVPAGMSNCSIIEENRLGLVVHSLDEAVALVEAMTESEYQEYVRSVGQFAPALKKGYYTKKCLIEALLAFYRKDAGKALIPDKFYHVEDCEFTSTVLKESYGGNLAFSWSCKGKPDGFLIYDISKGAVLCDTRNVYQHYALLKNCEMENGFVVMAYLETLRGKLIIAESEQTYLCPGQYEVPKVSLIMPAYNAEDYIVRGIDTALAQSFSDLEIIVIDDGSTDHTSEIIDWYAEKYANVVAIHQENRGVVEARNTGIKRADGEFIGFMDSDDMLRPYMIARLYDSVKKNNCDIAITSAYWISDKGYVPIVQYPMEKDIAVAVEDFLRIIKTHWGYTVVVWNKLYRASIVKEHLFPALKHDDEVWTPYILSYAEKVCYLDDLAYEYDRIIRKSTLVDEWSKSRSWEEQFAIYKSIILFYLKNCNPKRRGLLKEVAKQRLAEKGIYNAEYGKLREQIDEMF